jgi:hypothetical protein
MVDIFLLKFQVQIGSLLLVWFGTLSKIMDKTMGAEQLKLIQILSWDLGIMGLFLD